MFIVYHPSNLYFTPLPSNPSTLGRRQRRLEGKGTADLFRLLPAKEGRQVPWARLHPAIANAAATGTRSRRGSSCHEPSRALEFIPSQDSRILNTNYLQLAKITPLLEHETIIVNGRGWSEATRIPHLGLKQKTYSHNRAAFLKKPKFSLQAIVEGVSVM